MRESAVFSGILLTGRLSERTSGVWAVDTRSGQVVAFLRFEQAVQEIFAVRALPGVRFPEILGPDDELIATAYMLPDVALGDVPEERRG